MRMKFDQDWLAIVSCHLDKVARVLVALFMIGICLDVLFGVVNRFIFRFSVSWTEELARYLMIWICMLGASIALKAGGHIGFTFFLMKLKKLKTAVISMNYFLILIFVSTVAIWGFRLCITQRYQFSPAMRLSMLWPFLSVPVGSLFMIVHLLFLMKCLIEKNNTLAKENFKDYR